MSRNQPAITGYVPKRRAVREYAQKPPPITRDEKLAAQRDRGIYENAQAIVKAAIAAGVGIKLPEKKTKGPVYILGTVDSNGAIHGVPVYSNNAGAIHSDFFTSAFKRWRWIPGKGITIPEVRAIGVTLAEYELDETERYCVELFVTRKGWA